MAGSPRTIPIIASSTSQQVTSKFLAAVISPQSAQLIEQITYAVLTKPLFRVGGEQDVSHIATTEQQDIGIHALGQVSRKADSRCVAYGVERVDNGENRWGKHLR